MFVSLIFDFNKLTLLKSKIRDTNKHTKEKIITLFFSKKGSILFFSNVVFVSRGERNHACCCFYVEEIPNKRRRDTKIVSYAKKKIKASHTSREAFTPYKRKLRFVRGERNHGKKRNEGLQSSASRLHGLLTVFLRSQYIVDLFNSLDAISKETFFLSAQ